MGEGRSEKWDVGEGGSEKEDVEEERREKQEGGVSYISICTVQSRSGKERGRGEKKKAGGGEKIEKTEEGPCSVLLVAAENED